MKFYHHFEFTSMLEKLIPSFNVETSLSVARLVLKDALTCGDFLGVPADVSRELSG